MSIVMKFTTTGDGNRVPAGDTSARRIAYEYIRSHILSGEFEGAQRITAEEIAGSIGLSRMPVRQALGQLQAEGLVTLLANRGAIVTLPTVDQVRELFEMRAVLEGLAAALARKSLTDMNILELKTLNMWMENMRPDPKAWTSRHGEFHRVLAALSGRPRLTQQIEVLHASLQPIIAMHISASKVSHLAENSHLDLVEAIRSSRNSRTAENVARAHVMASADGVLAFWAARAAVPRLRPA
jgi:DNA-binding GntR family transcriptional regulator